MPQDIRERTAQIDELVRMRAVGEAKSKIVEWVRSEGANDRAVLKACEWYFKLGTYREGLKLLERSNLRGGKSLWAARFLNQLGASVHALSLIRRCESKTKADHRFIGGIYQANFEFARAVESFRKAFPSVERQDIVQDPMGVLSYSDSLAGLGDFNRAIALASRVSEETPVPLNRAIAQQALGEYLAMTGKFRKGLEALLRSQKLFPSQDTSPDSVFLKKWLGYSYFKLGKTYLGKRLLEEAFQELRGLAIRDETWLHVLYLQAKLGILSRKRVAKFVRYPGLHRHLQESLPVLENWQDGIVSDREHLFIDQRSDEYVYQGKRSIGLSAELELVAWVYRAALWGVSLQRLSQMLWPDEPLQYLQQQQRIHQMLHRLRRKYRVNLVLKESRIYFPEGGNPGLGLRIGSFDGPTLLRRSSSFSAKEFSEYYPLSTSRRTVILKEWLKLGWIEKMERGLYRISRIRGPHPK